MWYPSLDVRPQCLYLRGSSCVVCKRGIPLRMGKQGYVCRDCGIITHKPCHIKVGNNHDNRAGKTCYTKFYVQVSHLIATFHIIFLYWNSPIIFIVLIRILFTIYPGWVSLYSVILTLYGTVSYYQLCFFCYNIIIIGSTMERIARYSHHSFTAYPPYLLFLFSQ